MRSSYQRLLKYAWREWPALLAIAACNAGLSLIASLQPLPLKWLMDHGVGGLPVPANARGLLAAVSLEPDPLTVVMVAAAVALGLFLLSSLADAGLTRAWATAGQRMVYGLAADLFGRLQRLSLLFHGRTSVGDSLSRLTGDSWCVYTIVEAMLMAPVQHVFTLATLGAVAWVFDPFLTALSLSVTPVLGAASLYFGRRIKARTRANREAQARLASFVHQTLQSIPVVQAFGLETANCERFGSLARQACAAGRTQAVYRHLHTTFNGLTLAAGAAIVLYAGGRRVLEGTLSLGSLLVFLGYLRPMQSAFQGLFGIYGSLKSAEASIDRIVEVMDEVEAIADPPSPAAFPAREPRQGAGVVFEDVTFGYQPDTPALKDVSFSALPGQLIAIVGPTGSGKSTLASMIPRFHDPWRGRVLMDGLDVRGVRVADLRGRVSMMLQEPFLLPLSVAHNIAYGRPGASREEIVRAARTANAEEFVLRLPEGYDTIIGERGATLSVGQRQRLAIARAFLKQAPVLILDEPTSALDAESEQLVLQALEDLMRTRTTFVIAHRLSTVRRADLILVMSGGRIVQSGRHDSLVAEEGLYRTFCESQLRGPPTGGRA
jgi:ATP-binding cassette, subfamily B, bacterial